MRCQSFKRGGIDPQIRHGLPAIHGHTPTVKGSTTTQIEHQTGCADSIKHRFQPILTVAELFVKNIAGDNDVGCASFDERQSIRWCDPSSDLQSLRIGRKRLSRRRFITLALHDNVTAGQTVALVERGIV